ncbi:MAG: SCO family protein [Rhizobiaceae bacterium]
MSRPSKMFRNFGLSIALLLGLGAGAIGSLYSMKATIKVSEAPLPLAPRRVDKNNTLGFPMMKNGDFDLIDQNGQPRTSINPNGEHQLIFFGYANCKAMCSVALPNLAKAVDLLEAMKLSVTPILITVDPERDTVENLNKAATDIHPKLVGLTGTQANLAIAYKTFNVEKKFLFNHIDEGPIYSHGSFLYLLGPKGDFKTIFAPIISPTKIAEISAGYITQSR